MHTLSRVSVVTDDPVYTKWALELAQVAHKSFIIRHPGAEDVLENEHRFKPSSSTFHGTTRSSRRLPYL